MLKKIRLKVAIIGPPFSGKSAFVNNLLEKKFDPFYNKTSDY
jgi:GTPase Era involved in 16S rRNA processing